MRTHLSELVLGAQSTKNGLPELQSFSIRRKKAVGELRRQSPLYRLRNKGPSLKNPIENREVWMIFKGTGS